MGWVKLLLVVLMAWMLVASIELYRLERRSPVTTGPSVPRWAASIDAVGSRQVGGATRVQLTRPSGDTVVRGWALDGQARQPGSGVDVRLDETKIEAQYGAARPDVAEAFGDAGARRSGFTARIPARLLTPGSHRLRIRATPSGDVAYVTGWRSVTVVVT